MARTLYCHTDFIQTHIGILGLEDIPIAWYHLKPNSVSSVSTNWNTETGYGFLVAIEMGQNQEGKIAHELRHIAQFVHGFLSYNPLSLNGQQAWCGGILTQYPHTLTKEKYSAMPQEQDANKYERFASNGGIMPTYPVYSWQPLSDYSYPLTSQLSLEERVIHPFMKRLKEIVFETKKHSILVC